MLKKLSFALALVTIGFIVWVTHQLKQPQGGDFPEERVVEIPKGTGSRQISTLLAEKGVVSSPWLFLTARALRLRTTLQAGEYSFSKPASIWEIFDRIARGDVLLHELRIPEGSNLFDIAEAVEALGMGSKEAFRVAASDPTLIRDIDPEATSLEGYLFPSTYRLSRRTTPAQICRLMTDQFRAVWKKLGAPGKPHELVTLASLVEKETGVDTERPMVAGVYKNRLARGIKLECDPTTIYAAILENRYRGKIHRSDLDNRHPYNTYQHEGLPPGPIANPGEESLRAAIAPADTENIFFVAKPDHSGGHNFSANIHQHSIAVAAYRRGEKKAASGVANGR
jgi:UPF0755 protein